ncbi:MAG: hypothetical protein ACXW0R_03595 [Gaiellaceae bacterium]
MRRGRGISLLALVYVGVGVAVAANHNYFDNVHGWRGVVSGIFAVFLWPLILLGIDLHVKK